MANSFRTGTLVIVIAAAMLVLFSGGFLLNVLQSGFGGFITTLSVLVFGAAILALVVSFNLYRRAKSAG
jgi:hypothetical protein